jgi:hypothetical protein
MLKQKTPPQRSFQYLFLMKKSGFDSFVQLDHNRTCHIHTGICSYNNTNHHRKSKVMNNFTAEKIEYQYNQESGNGSNDGSA